MGTEDGYVNGTNSGKERTQDLFSRHPAVGLSYPEGAKLLLSVSCGWLFCLLPAALKGLA